MALTVKRVAKLVGRGIPARCFDSSGLYLAVTGRGTGHWERRYTLHGHEHYIGLGSVAAFNLDEARERNRRISQSLADRIDPLEQKRAERAQRAAAAARQITFGECATEFFKTNAPTWKHRAHVAQWSSSILGKTLNGKNVNPDYCHALRPLPVQSIDTPLVMRVLQPHWHERPETMSRIRSRVAAVLDWAKASSYRTGDNPADWDVIGKLLPARSKVAKVKHFKAVDYRELPAFMAELQQREGMAARALEFLVLVAARTSEALHASWPELDLAEATWTIPASRMKGGKDHRVPLSAPVVELLRGLPREGDFVFVGRQQGKPLSRMSLIALLQRMGRSVTTHGFRSSFSDWAHERGTGHSNHAIELSLAHSIGNAAEAAYRRGDLFAKRRRLMEQWTDYCASPPVAARGKNVVPLKRATS